MRKDLVTAIVAVAALTVLLGVAYPLLTTGVGQVLFSDQANGSQVERDGRVVGSSLIGQDFRRPAADPATGRPQVDEEGEPVLEPDPRYFQPRPSQTGYAADASAFSNLGPNGTDTRAAIAANVEAYLALEGRYDGSLGADDVPVDAATQSGSGIDPQISERNARIQARRIAAVRHLPLERVRQLVSDHTAGRQLGVLGEPGVNVLELNLALDQTDRSTSRR